jgi:hypothetical protein
MKEQNLTVGMLSDDERAIYEFSHPDNYYNYRLKGVVVHYGTADGGHYYSYIRWNEDEDRFICFNDTNVTEYDPANLPDDTFGGKLLHEQRYTQGGKQYVQSEKLHNAYLLIYERKEYIDYHTGEIIRDAKQMNYNIEPEVIEELSRANDRHWISSKIFDPCFITTISNMCIMSSFYLSTYLKQAESKTSKGEIDPPMEVDENDSELTKLKFTLLFLWGVTIRSESRFVVFDKLIPALRGAIKANKAFACWILQWFSREETIDEILLNAAVAESRRIVAGLLKEAMNSVYPAEAEIIAAIIQQAKQDGTNVEGGVADKLIKQMQDNPGASNVLSCLYSLIMISIRKEHPLIMNSISDQFFSVLHEFAWLSEDTRDFMLIFKYAKFWTSLLFGVWYTIEGLLPDVSLSNNQDVEMKEEFEIIPGADDKKFEDTNLGNFISYNLSKYELIRISNYNKDSVNYLFLIKLLSKLLRSWEIRGESKLGYEDSPFKMNNEKPLDLIELDEMQELIVPTENNLNILMVNKCNNKPLRNELALLYGHLLYDEECSIKLFKQLLQNLNHVDYKEIINFERILKVQLSMKDSLHKDRINTFLELSYRIMENNYNDFAYTDVFAGMIIKFSKHDVNLRKSLYQHNLVDYINKWLGKFSSPPIRSYRTQTTIFKNEKHNHKFSFDLIQAEQDLIKSHNIKRREMLKKMYQSPKWKTAEPDSEDDLFETDLEVGTKVDFVPYSTQKWTQGTVKISLGETFKIQEEVKEMDVDGIEEETVHYQYLTREDLGLAPFKYKTKSLKAKI